MEPYLLSKQLQRQKIVRRIKLYGWFGAIALFLIFIIYFLAVSPAFKIKITISGLKRLSENELQQALKEKIFQNLLARFLGADNYLSWPSIMSLRTPLVANLIINKNLLEKKIDLTVIERQPWGILCLTATPSSCYWFDKEGIIFEDAPLSEGYLILRINADGVKPLLGQKMMPEEWYDITQKIIDFFVSRNLTVDYYELKNELQEFHAHILNGPLVRFSMRFAPQTSLSALDTFMQNNDLQKVSYIDFTVENRLYWK